MGPLISAEKRSCGERQEVRHWETLSYPGRAVFTQRDSGDVIDLALSSVSSSNTSQDTFPCQKLHPESKVNIYK